MSESPEIRQARQVLEIEAEAILSQKESLGESFQQAIEVISDLRGKVVVTGIGKSGIVGMKVAATLASTGTPAIFMHAVDAIHGDLGAITKDDLLLAISNSGETEEVLNVIQAAQQVGVTALAFCGSAQSTLATMCDHLVVVAVDREACPLGLAPTASTTAALAVGDALSMALSSRRKFTAKAYAAIHPGGSLGQRLKLCVRDLMRTGEQIPVVTESQSLSEAIHEMTNRENLGTALIVDDAGKLNGILTDGDLRRILLTAEDEGQLDWARPVSEVMIRGPKTIEADAAVSGALQIMERSAITSLAIVDASSTPVGFLHLHDILGRGKVVF